jgi:hypothetical protein
MMKLVVEVVELQLSERTLVVEPVEMEVQEHLIIF